MNRTPFEILGAGAEEWCASDDADLQHLGSALDQWVQQGGVGPLDRALFGLAGVGRRKLTTVEAMTRRNALLVEAVAFFPDNKAEGISSALDRYRSGAWLLDRTAESCPDRYVGRLNGLLFEILRMRDASLGPRRIEQILCSEMSTRLLIS